MPASVRLERPSPIAFELADGRLVIVQPPTRAQVRAAIAHDPKEGEIRTHAQMNDQRARQLAALVGAKVTVREMRDGTEHDHEEDSGPILAGLTFEEESDMLIALTSYGFGQDPAAAAAGRLSGRLARRVQGGCGGLEFMVWNVNLLRSAVAAGRNTRTPHTQTVTENLSAI